MDEPRALAALAALGQPARLAAFRLLVAAEPDGMPAGDIAARLATPHNTLSTHLTILHRANLVSSARQGRIIRYRADLAGLRALMAFLLQDCCGGRAAACAPLLDAILPAADTRRPAA